MEPTATDTAESLTHNGRPMLWQADGYVVPDGGVLTADELLELSGLDYKVKLEKFSTDDTGATCGRFRSIVRQDTKQVLGVCQSRWRPYDNNQLFSFLDNLVNADEALYEGAWSWKGGAQAGVIMRLPEKTLIAEFDRHQAYLYAQVAHNAAGSLRIGAFMTRLSCTNMVQGLLRGAQYQFRAVHSSSMNVQIANARSALAMGMKITKDFDVQALRMIATPAGEDFARACAERVWKDNEKKVKLALANFRASQTIAEDIRFTRYGVYAALTEASEWLMPRTPSFERSLQGASANERSKVLELCLS